jgi:AraC family transcriptional regulator
MEWRDCDELYLAQVMPQGSVSASQFPNLLSAPPYVSAAWRTFALQLADAPRQMSARFTDHVLSLIVDGSHRLRQRVESRTFEGRSDPGDLCFVPAGLDMSSDASSSPRVLLLFVPSAFLSRVITEHWGANPDNVEILWKPPAGDRVAESVMMSLASEAQNGSPAGQLYAESACEFLAHHIVRAYSSLSTPLPRATGGLPGARLKMVLEYIEDNLGQPIALRQMAALSGVSPRHFERAFRQAMGAPPHAYVLKRRLTAARELILSQPSLSIEEIAAKTGFSSSSHLASAFRRETGYSPKTFRLIHGI